MISLLHKFALKYPIIQAPMAGAASKNLTVAVSKAGALGSFGAGYLTAEDIKSHLHFFKQHSQNAVYNINLFIAPKQAFEREAYAQELQDLQNFLQPLTEKFGLKPNFDLPKNTLFSEQIKVLLEEKIPVLSFTFGALEKELILEFKKNNTFIIGTATSQNEALILQDIGCDAIVAQGKEAGGHRGCFEPETNQIQSLEQLLKSLHAVKTPIIAAGGIMRGDQIAHALSLGAQMVQMGTAFLVCDENDGIPLSYKQAILQNPRIVSTSAVSGRIAQGIQNPLFNLLEQFANEQKIKGRKKLPYPITHFFTANLRKKSAEQNNLDYIAAWAGQNAAMARALPVQKLLESLSAELQTARGC